MEMDHWPDICEHEVPTPGCAFCVMVFGAAEASAADISSKTPAAEKYRGPEVGSPHACNCSRCDGAPHTENDFFGSPFLEQQALKKQANMLLDEAWRLAHPPAPEPRMTRQEWEQRQRWEEEDRAARRYWHARGEAY